MYSTVVLTFTFAFIQSVISQHGTFGPAVYQLTAPLEHAEGPTWDNRTGLLYFVDIPEGKVLSYRLENGELNYIKFDGDVTPVVPSKKDPQLLMIGLNRTLVAFKWDGKRLEHRHEKQLTTVAKEFPSSRFNDGKADKQGRLWFGTMGYENASGVLPNEGSLYFITRGNMKNPPAIITPVTVSNGLAWNRANDKFYYIDTPTYQIMEYDYEDATGKISNPRIVFDFRNHTGTPGYPDGMTIDKDDNLWVALHGGGSVVKVDPIEGRILKVIAMPAQYCTSVMWGGPDLDILFVTTSRRSLNALQRQQQPGAGSLFAITCLGTSGLPVFYADIFDGETTKRSTRKNKSH